jgi:hypothetical protein
MPTDIARGIRIRKMPITQPALTIFGSGTPSTENSTPRTRMLVPCVMVASRPASKLDR